MTVVIVRDDLLARSADSLPTMLNFKTQAENGSLYNTPPVFGIYILRLVLKWLVGTGGLDAIGQVNERKAKVLYDELDRTDFWKPHADEGQPLADEHHVPACRAKTSRSCSSRSRTAAGFDGLKGHRSVGGIRASIYNAFPEARRHRSRRVHAGVRAPQRLVSRISDARHNSRAAHPGRLRCSSLKYAQYSRSSRLAVTGAALRDLCHASLIRNTRCEQRPRASRPSASRTQSPLAGTVRSIDGAPVAGARVVLHNPGAAAVVTTTDKAGAFSFATAVRPVEVRVSAPGFAPTTSSPPAHRSTSFFFQRL